MERIISISAVAYDGYPAEVAFEHIKKIGADYVELALIEGYVESINEELFSIKEARNIKQRLKENDLSCHTISAHTDLGTKNAVEKFLIRMEFATEIGAKIIISNAALKSEEKQFYKNMEKIIPHADTYSLLIGLENPGDGRDNIINTGKEAIKVVEKVGSPWIKLNYDCGNLITHHQGKIKPEEDLNYAIPHCIHFHIKDVIPVKDGWEFPVVGKGIIDYKTILSSLVKKDTPFSLEVPVRLRRKKDSSPYRLPEPVDIKLTDTIIKESFNFIRNVFSSTS